MADNDVNQSSAAASDDDAIKRAKEKMQQAISSKESGEEVKVEQASTKATVEDAKTSGSRTKKEKPVDDGKHLRQVRVYSPYKVYFDGPATSVTAENETGVFDVLPGHKNFMSLLIASDIIVRTDRGEERVKTNSAVMHVADNIVKIFLDV